MSISRQELLSKRNDVLSKIENNKTKIENLNKNYKCNRYYEGYGVPSELKKKDLLEATENLLRETDTAYFNAAAKELGFDEVSENELTLYGYTKEEWLADFKNRAAIINLEIENKKHNKALNIIERNLSEDDKFSLEMEELEDLIK